jgi:3-oxoadipate enol-lactonase
MPYAQLSKVRVHYYETGDRATAAETVVFVHGFQASGRIWQLMQELLPPTYYTVAVDNRGAGETGAPPDEADFGCKPFADDLFELVERLGLREFTLVGHSMGGATVMQFAVDHAQVLRSLVLLDPSGPDGWALDGPALEAELDRRSAERARQREAGRVGEHMLDSLGNAPEAFARALAADMAAAPERRLRGSMRSMASLRLGEGVGRLPMPVMLAGGDADRTVPLSSMLATFAKLPAGSSLQIWHGAGHSPNVEIPVEATAVLRRFVEQTVPSTSAAAVAAGA